jgi:two-component system, response regulator PdtaR
MTVGGLDLGDHLAAILVVEDDALVRMVTSDILFEAGYHVIEAVNADEALILLEARPDIRLMVTDVRMPGELSGYGLARAVSLRWPNVAIVVVSGDTMPGNGDLPNGARFIAKPFQPSVFVQTIEELLLEEPIVVDVDGSNTVAEDAPAAPLPTIPFTLAADLPTANAESVGGMIQPLAEPDKS